MSNNGFIGIDIEGLPSLLDKLNDIPTRGIPAGLGAVAEYLRGVFRKEPAYKYASRAAAYPEVGGFFSERQRRFVMAGIREGWIRPGSPNRTGALRKGWRVLGKGTLHPILVNEESHSVFAHDDTDQARQLGLAGWEKVSAVLDARSGRIASIFADEINRVANR